MIVENEAACIDALPTDLGWHNFESRYTDTDGAKKDVLVFFFDQSAAMSHAWWWQPQTASLC